jgi:hypothetical protein
MSAYSHHLALLTDNVSAAASVPINRDKTEIKTYSVGPWNGPSRPGFTKFIFCLIMEAEPAFETFFVFKTNDKLRM